MRKVTTFVRLHLPYLPKRGMTSLRRRIGTACSLCLLCLPIAATGAEPSEMLIDRTWETLSVFEGSPTSVTEDFDCQGMSIGIAQWNIGKSFSSVRSIIDSVPREQVIAVMPTYGHQLLASIAEGKSATMELVRSLHVYEDPSSCNSRERKARWSREGRLFREEVRSLLARPEALRKQRDLRREKFLQGWSNARRWSEATRGRGSSPTSREVFLFVDMAIFNGGGFEKFGLSRDSVDTADLESLCGDVLRYMSEANESFLLHKVAARKNAGLLRCNQIETNEKILFVLSHRLAMKLNAEYSKQFRLTVLNRRAAILFGQAYYSDRDSTPITIPTITNITDR